LEWLNIATIRSEGLAAALKVTSRGEVMQSAIRRTLGKVARGQSTPLRVVFTDQSSYQNREAEPEVTIVFKSKRAERRTALFGYVGFFEYYFEGEVDILGMQPVRKLIHMAYASGYKHTTNPLIRFHRRRLEHRQSNREYARAKANARAHYGVPVELFRALLGETICYAEGHWPEGTETLDEAQHKRCDYICRKLLLRPGDKMVEVGSAWGYMSMLAAEKYGANVINYGLVPEQNVVMQQRLVEKGLTDRVKIIEKDHRELKREPDTYDKYVSIGVYEHAGMDCQRGWIESIAVALKPGGIGVLATTTYMENVPTEYLTIKYVFPGGQVPSLPLTLALMDEFGLHVVDVEDLSAHYQRTGEEWLRNLDSKWPEIKAIDPGTFTEKFRRIWTYYLSGVVENFRPGGGNLNLHHITFEKGKGYYPKTRDFLYSKK
jgi:cyclopropane-fatty-acyl-phospholipid synthase